MLRALGQAVVVNTVRSGSPLATASQWIRPHFFMARRVHYCHSSSILIALRKLTLSRSSVQELILVLCNAALFRSAAD